MDPKKIDRAERRRQVKRIFDEQGWESLTQIDDWDGADLEALRETMSEERFEALMDELAEGGSHER